MLTITDLHNEQEMSLVEMGKVAGGECGNDVYSSAAATMGNIFSTLGCKDAAQTCFNAADSVRSGPYCL